MGLLARYLVVALASAVLPARCYEAQQPITPHELSQPLIGFGTWNLKLSEENTTEAVSLAIQAGYRQIDCAAIYRNEKEVGRGIADGLKKANISREELWVTSKLWNSRHGDPVLVESGLMQTLDDLGLDYVDLYLMHWPVGHDEGTNENRLDYVETWRSMVALPTTKAAHIGVANFSPAQLREIISKTTVKPYAHQMELHPYLPQSGWVAAHKALGISVTAYSPFGNTNPTYKNIQRPPPLLKNDVLVGIAEARNCTPAQVALAWGMGRETSVIPKSSHPEHILENLESSKCILQYEDLARLRLMGRKYLTRFSNPSRSWGVKLFEGLEDA